MVISQFKYLAIALGLFCLPLGAITKEERIRLLGESATGMIAPENPITLQEPETQKVEASPKTAEPTDLKKFEQSIPAVSEEGSPLKNLDKAIQSNQTSSLFDSIVKGLNQVAALQNLYYSPQTNLEKRKPASKNLDPLTASAYNPPSK